MRTDIKATLIELTDAIREFVQKKMDALDAPAARFGSAVRAKVEVGKTTKHHKNGDVFRAEVRLDLPGLKVYAEEIGDDLYVVMNDAYKEARRQMISYKGILQATALRGERKVKRAAHDGVRQSSRKGGRVREEGV